MEENLRKKAFWGIVWNYIGRFGGQVISIVPAMILARLLGPDQYGLIAMASVFTGIAYQLADAGFGNALVQKKDADDLDYNTVFYFNISICGVIYGLIYLCAPLIADFFHEPILTSIVRVSSIGIIFVAFGAIQNFQFIKAINFKLKVTRSLAAQTVSMVISIIMAYMGYGVWALVAQGLIYTFTSTLLNWFISSWRPSLVFSFERLKRLFGYGSKLLCSSMIDYGFNRIYDIIIGRIYSPVALGLYNRGNSTAAIFKDTFFGVFSSVTFPLFVKMQDDDERLKRNIRKFMSIVTMLIFTVMLGVMILGDPLFRFMYSSKWDAAVPFFRLACIVAMIQPVISILESIILAKGYSGKFLIISIIRKFIVVAVIAVVWKFGVIWLLVGQIFINICECMIYIFVTTRIIRYTLRNLLADIIPSLVLGLGIALLVYVLDNFVVARCLSDFGDTLVAFLRLTLGGILMVVSFVMICKNLKLKCYREFIQFLEDTMGKKKIITILRA